MTDYVFLKVPTKAWAVLCETLEMDMQSSAFDPSLRAEIAKAYDKVKEIPDPARKETANG